MKFIIIPISIVVSYCFACAGDYRLGRSFKQITKGFETEMVLEYMGDMCGMSRWRGTTADYISIETMGPKNNLRSVSVDATLDLTDPVETRKRIAIRTASMMYIAIMNSIPKENPENVVNWLDNATTEVMKKHYSTTFMGGMRLRMKYFVFGEAVIWQLFIENPKNSETPCPD